MFTNLCAYGIPEQLVNVIRDVNTIKDMYSNIQAKVVSPDGKTKPCKVTSVVLQGNSLAPYLFVIVLDYALWKAMQGREEDLGFCLKK